MKKLSIEILQTAGDRATIILPDSLDHAELLGLVNALLERLGLASARIVIQEHAVAPPLEKS
jgi:hypothetical protein